jgi:hypothetical protein
MEPPLEVATTTQDKEFSRMPIAAGEARISLLTGLPAALGRAPVLRSRGGGLVVVPVGKNDLVAVLDQS